MQIAWQLTMSVESSLAQEQRSIPLTAGLALSGSRTRDTRPIYRVRYFVRTQIESPRTLGRAKATDIAEARKRVRFRRRPRTAGRNRRGLTNSPPSSALVRIRRSLKARSDWVGLPSEACELNDFNMLPRSLGKKRVSSIFMDFSMIPQNIMPKTGRSPQWTAR